MHESDLSGSWLKQAREAYQEEDWESALAVFQDTCRLGPRDPRPRLGAALCLLALDRTQEALLTLQTLTCREGRFGAAVADAILGRRTALTRLEEALPLGSQGLCPGLPAPALTRALHRLEQGLRQNPRSPAAWTFRGVLLDWLGCSPEAFGSLAAALRVDPGYLPAITLQDEWLAQLLCLPAPAPARREEVPEEALVPRPRESRPDWYRSHLLGDDAGALYACALAHFQAQRWEEAQEYLRRVNLVEPEHLPAAQLRFEVLLGLGEESQAREQGYHAMDLLEGQDRLAEAIALGARMFALWPDDERLMCKHQLLYHRAGQAEQAARWTFELIRRHRLAQRFEGASAALYWLLRTPLSGAARIRAELLLLAILLASGRFGPALDRLEVLLAQWELAQLTGDRSYNRRAGTVRRLLATAGTEDGAARERLAALTARLQQLLGDSG